MCNRGVCVLAEQDADDIEPNGGGDEGSSEDGGALDAGSEDGGGQRYPGPPDAGPQDAELAALGVACSSSSECSSGVCVRGVCCDSACNGQICQRCDEYSVSGAGHCDVARAGTDLAGECSPPTVTCSGLCTIRMTTFACSGASYACASHRTTTPIASGYVCASNAAVPVGKANFCDMGNNCAEGMCQASRWWTSCDGHGSCRAATDSKDACTEPVVASAGQSLTRSCATNGATSCGATCAASGATYWTLCDGASRCTSTSALAIGSCGIYACDLSSARCKSHCSTDADCVAPNVCTPPNCHRNWDLEWPRWGVSNPRSFTTNDDGTVKDNVTGLVWQQGISDREETWSSATAYCAGLTLAGGGWRLPTRIELLTIVDPRTSDPAIDTGVFSLGAWPGVASWFWSATPNASGPDEAWYVDFGLGSANALNQASGATVRCVR